MLDRLRGRGCTVVRYGKDDTKALVAAFSSIGMSIPGPSQEQLQICAELIAKATEALAGLASKALDNEAKSLERSAFNVARVYKDVVTHTWQHGDDSLLAEAARNNAAVNNQSIVSSFHVGTSSFLFSGDMQWSLPGGSRELHIEIEKLLDKLTGQDRCDFFKLAHHGSNNGFSAQVWERIKRPLAMGICTGTDSKGHPNPATLDELEEILQNKNKEVRWARTDHNCYVTRYSTARDRPSNSLVERLMIHLLTSSTVLLEVATKYPCPSLYSSESACRPLRHWGTELLGAPLFTLVEGPYQAS